MGVGERRSTTALFALIGALSLDHMHAFAARMGSSALLPALAKSAPSSLRRQPRQVRKTIDSSSSSSNSSSSSSDARGGLTYDRDSRACSREPLIAPSQFIAGTEFVPL